ncbi:FdhF/YdeP family oxidoreductase [Sorangium sp. So ce176]|uniref:FdhF/YdeP family oxidoreductase n=1 Tax=Sorangium sp. So ce176 TaxID=3133286 RepID=UPI003F5F472C
MSARDVLRDVQAEPPPEPEAPRIGERSAAAGGLAAIGATLQHAVGEMGVSRAVRTLLRVNQGEGFDCPGCAWPEPEEKRSVAEFCENGAKAVAEEATLRRVTPELFRKHSVEELSKQSDHWLGKQGRLVHPMLLEEGATHYRPASWDEALDIVASSLRALGSPDEAVFYTSGRTSNEAAFLYQLFVRELGTNNLPDCSNMCHESSGVGLREAIGVAKGTVSLQDFEIADAIFVVGQNPGTNHPRMLSALREARQRGCEIVTVNPLPEVGSERFQHPQHPLDLVGPGAPISTLFLQVRINGDVALFTGLIKEMLEEEERRPGAVLDRAFIARHTDGFEAFAAAVRATPWDEIVEQSGVPRDRIRAAAEIAMRSERTIACWAMGLTQHKNGVANVQQVMNFLLLRGNIGRPGAGACPVRGHSNVQGDRTMGIWERPPAELLDRIEKNFGFSPPRRHGLDTVAAIAAMADGRARVFFALGGNFLSATPDTAFTARALARCDLTAHVSTKLNRAHLVTGRRALILPCLGRTERDVQARGPQFVTVENSMGVVSSSRGNLPPASEVLRSEVAIVAGLARATLGALSRVPWEELTADYDRIRDLIERTIDGFDDFNARVKDPRGFALPNAAARREFRTATGKANFIAHPLPRHELEPGELLMMTIRSHDQYNTTIYGLDDRYRGVRGGRRVVFMNAEDAAERGLEQGDLVDVTSRFSDGERVARAFRVVLYEIPRGNVAAYFPEANVLVPLGSMAEKSHTPASKSIVVRVRASDARGGSA